MRSVRIRQRLGEVFRYRRARFCIVRAMRVSQVQILVKFAQQLGSHETLVRDERSFEQWSDAGNVYRLSSIVKKVQRLR